MQKINQLSLKSQQGFTLIELVVVIVILGILAATAAPKFIDLTGDANAATIKAVRGSVESANSLVHAKALISGKTSKTAVQTVSINGVNTNVFAGWPTNDVATWNNILTIDSSDFTALTNGTSGSTTSAASIIWFPTPSSTLSYTDAVATSCYAIYTESDDKTVKPVIDVIFSGC